MMPRDQRSFDENEWTPDERARFAGLTAERFPPRQLEQRTVAALRERGLIGRRARFSPAVIIGLLLAASIVFAAGALVGYAAAHRTPAKASERAFASTRSVAQLDSADSTARRARHVVWY